MPIQVNSDIRSGFINNINQTLHYIEIWYASINQDSRTDDHFLIILCATITATNNWEPLTSEDCTKLYLQIITVWLDRCQCRLSHWSGTPVTQPYQPSWTTVYDTEARINSKVDVKRWWKYWEETHRRRVTLPSHSTQPSRSDLTAWVTFRNLTHFGRETCVWKSPTQCYRP